MQEGEGCLYISWDGVRECCVGAFRYTVEGRRESMVDEGDSVLMFLSRV